MLDIPWCRFGLSCSPLNRCRVHSGLVRESRKFMGKIRESMGSHIRAHRVTHDLLHGRHHAKNGQSKSQMAREAPERF